MTKPITNTEVADLLGVDISVVSHVRRGDRTLSLEKLLILHTELGVPLLDLCRAKVAGPAAFGEYFNAAVPRRLTRKTT